MKILNLEQHFLILPFKLEQLGGNFDILEHVSKLFDKVINLVDELGSDSHEAVPNLILPILNGLGVHVVAPDRLRGKFFYPFKFIHMLFV